MFLITDNDYYYSIFDNIKYTELLPGSLHSPYEIKEELMADDLYYEPFVEKLVEFYSKVVLPMYHSWRKTQPRLDYPGTLPPVIANMIDDHLTGNVRAKPGSTFSFPRRGGSPRRGGKGGKRRSR
jgi:hypothetical protein